MIERVLAACDGACKGNPGPAAWAWVIAREADGRPGRWAAGPLGTATNNIAELTALDQLLAATDPGEPLEVRMDSQYAMNAVTTWLPGWRRRGWKTASGSPVANRDLVVHIDALLAGRDVTFVYVPAHQAGGDPLNAFADQEASAVAVSQRASSGTLPREQAERMAVPAVTAPAKPSAGSAAKSAPKAARSSSSGGGASGSAASGGAPSGGAGSGAARSGGSAKTAAARSVTISAKFPGTCSCGKRYAAGEKIAKGPGGWGHVGCADSA